MGHGAPHARMVAWQALKAKLGLGGGPDALAAAIVARSQRREGFLNQLAEKYANEDENGGGSSSSKGRGRGGGGSSRRGGKAKAGAPPPSFDADPLDDAAFAAAQAKMLAKKGAR